MTLWLNEQSADILEVFTDHQQLTRLVKHNVLVANVTSATNTMNCKVRVTRAAPYRQPAVGKSASMFTASLPLLAVPVSLLHFSAMCLLLAQK